MERYNHLEPSLGMRSALTKGLALTSGVVTPDSKILAADAEGLHLAPCSFELSVPSVTRGPSSSKKKAVCFASNVRMKIIPNKSSSPSNKTWYSPEETKQLLEESMEAVKLRRHLTSMSEHDFEETYNESVRGLEHYLSKRHFKTFKLEQEAAIAAIPIFQAKMKARGLPIDREALSRLSQVLSAPARERAYQKGLQYARSSRPSQDTL